MTLYTLDELYTTLDRYFPESHLNEDRSFAHDQIKVAAYRLTQGSTIVAKVIGENHQEFDVSINVKRPTGRLRLGGACSCPVKFNCKHVVATLLAAAQEKKTETTKNFSHRDILTWFKAMSVKQQNTGSSKKANVHLRYILNTNPKDEYTLDIYRVFPADGGISHRKNKITFKDVFSPENDLFEAPFDHKLAWQLRNISADNDTTYILPKNISINIFEELISTNRLHWGSIKDPILSSINEIPNLDQHNSLSTRANDNSSNQSITLMAVDIGLSKDPYLQSVMTERELTRLSNLRASKKFYMLIPKGNNLEILKLEEHAYQPISSVELPTYFDASPYKDAYLYTGEDDQQLMNFHVHQIPALKELGWKIFTEDKYDFIPDNLDQNWYAKVEERKTKEDFSFEMGVEINGKQYNLLPLMIDLIERHPHLLDKNFLNNKPDDFLLNGKLPNGIRIPLPLHRVRAVLMALHDLWSHDPLDKSGKLVMNKLRAAELANIDSILKDSKLQWFDESRLRDFGEKILSGSKIENVIIPDTFRADLRPYQKEGVNWLQFLMHSGLSGVLADDMGLGKTVQTLAHILIEKKSGRLNAPCLVAAPTSLMPNWLQETNRFAPELKVMTLHGPRRAHLYKEIENYDIILTTYPLLVRDKEIFVNKHFHIVILDEAHLIKNPMAKMTQVAMQLQSTQRLCLTGTPLENHLGELWSLFHFLLPGLLGNRRQFALNFRGPIEKEQDSFRTSQLVSRVRPFMMRRTKSEVAQELPPKVEITQTVDLTEEQKIMYESVRLSMEARVQEAISERGFDRSRLVILDALLKLRQICCDPRLVNLPSVKRGHMGSKLELLMQMLPEMIEEGRRILLFSQFTSMLDLIKESLHKEEIPYLELTGKTKDRASPVNAFQAGEVPLMLISLKAGGTGLNLTRADTVIHFDPWWNPAAEAQATDRAHRIGQNKSVFVYKIITNGTVESKIIKMQELKRRLFNDIMDESGGSKPSFTSDDLQALLEPLD
jgi:SNF2 family DNA or RNA helicase